MQNIYSKKIFVSLYKEVGMSDQAFKPYVPAEQSMKEISLKAILLGITGSIAGYFFGLILGILWTNIIPFSFLFDIRLLFLVILISPVLSMVASWLPAVISIKQDPAIVLMKE